MISFHAILFAVSYLLCWQNVLLQDFECGGVADITFLIDDSDSTKRPVPGSTSSVQYAPGVVTFIQQFINNADLGNIRISLVLFSNTARLLTSFSTDPSELNSALDSFVPEFQGTNTAEGIQLLSQQYSDFGRVGVSRSAVIIIDGSSQDVGQANLQAILAESQGINIVSVAFDMPIPIPELQMLSIDPSEVFKVKSDILLSEISKNISDIICPGNDTIQTPVASTASTPLSFEDLCSTCRYKNGVGHVGHPTDCGRFIQCNLHENGMVATVRSCSIGTLWNEAKETCDYPLNVNCDPCKTLSEGNQYASTFLCSAFWECRNHISEPKCCGAGYVFKEGSGCIMDTGSVCHTPCQMAVTPSPSTTSTPCTKQRSPSGSGFYLELIPGFGLMDRPCPGGTEFIQSACSCLLTSILKQPDECSLFLGVHFNNQTSTDSSKNTFRLTPGPNVLYQENDLAKFIGFQSFVVPGIANVDFRDDVFLVVKFITTGSTVNQSIVNNSPCEDTIQPSLLIMAHDGSTAGTLDVIFLVRTTDDVVDQTITLNGNKNMFMTAVLSYNGSLVKAQLLDDSGNVLHMGLRTATGLVSIRKGALNIGGMSCNTTNSFVGLIDFVRLYKCQPLINATADDDAEIITTTTATTTVSTTTVSTTTVSATTVSAPLVSNQTDVSSRCYFMVSPKGAAYYTMYVNGIGYLDFPCPRGTLFHLPTCGCHQNSENANQVISCRVYLHIPFDNKAARDVSSNRFSSDVSPFITYPDSSTASFNGFGYVIVHGLSNVEFKKDFTLKIRFRPRSTKINGSPQVLIHNGGCFDSDAASFKITIADNVVNSSLVDVSFYLQTTNDVSQQTLLLSALKSATLEATLTYDGAHVKADLSDGIVQTSSSRVATGMVSVQYQPVNIGSAFCGGYPAFRGQVDDVKVYLCKNSKL